MSLYLPHRLSDTVHHGAVGQELKLTHPDPVAVHTLGHGQFQLWPIYKWHSIKRPAAIGGNHAFGIEDLQEAILRHAYRLAECSGRTNK